MAMTKAEKQNLELLLRDNAQLRAEVEDLAIKLKNQIKRGNALKMRGERVAAPESPSFQMEARRAWGKAHPGQIVPSDAAIRSWLAGRREPEHA